MLNFDLFEGENNQPPIVIIPGLFGSIANWRGMAKRLQQAGFSVLSVDQRNHGKSPHYASHTYEDMVADLLALFDHLDIDQAVICGHSMGGKVAMLLAHWHAARVAKLVVLDIAPVGYAHTHTTLIEALLDLPLSTLASRAQAELLLAEKIADKPVRLFLLQSLTRTESGFKWRLNLPVLLEYMPEISSFPELTSDYSGNALFLRGERSDYIQPQHEAKIRALFPNAKFVDIASAGHWLHAENPQSVFDNIMKFIAK